MIKSKVNKPVAKIAVVEKAIRDGYGEGLLEIGKNKDVFVLAADLASSTRAEWFAQKYPERFFQVGICEQNMMSAAAGMAAVGKVAYVNSFAVFNPGRNWDQLRVSVCYSNLNVKIHGSHGGITVGEDGATHQALEDIAITRVLPNLVVIVPCDSNEAKNAVIASYKHKGPVYIRTSRMKVPLIIKDNEKFEIGKAKIIKSGKSVTIIACGVMVHEAIKAAKLLKENKTTSKIDLEIINCPTIKPLDEKTILTSVKKTKCLVTAEEHQIAGGLGSAISELLSQKQPTPIEMVGMKDSFGESGTPKELMAKYEMDANAIVKAVLKVIGRKKK
jgi:transketolase